MPSTKLLRHSMFYNAHSNTSDMSNADVATKIDLHVYGYNQFADNIIQSRYLVHNPDMDMRLYITYNNFPDPDQDAKDPIGTPKGNTQRKRNSVAWQQNDIVNLRDAQHSPSIWLHNLDGTIYYQPTGLDEVYINLQRQPIRDFYQLRLVPYLSTLFNGIFYDNGHTRFRSQTGSDQSSLEYPTAGGGTAWWADELEFFEWMRSDVLNVQQGKNNGTVQKQLNNLQQGGAEEIERWLWAIQNSALDEFMIEFFGTRFDTTFPSGDGQWYRNLIKSEWAQAFGKDTMHVAQVDSPTAYANQNWTTVGSAAYAVGFSLASYLLTVGAWGYASIRLGADAHYDKAYWYPLFDEVDKLGVPIGRYSRSGNSYTRTFSNGSVTVDPVANTYSITVTNTNYLTDGSNIPPTLTQQVTRRFTVGDVISVKNYATHRQGKPMTWSITNHPDGTRINPVTGEWYGRIWSSNRPVGGKYTPTITVSDGTLSVSTTFDVWVYSGVRVIGLTTQSSAVPISVPNNDGTYTQYISDSQIGAALSGGSLSNTSTQPALTGGIPPQYVSNFQPPAPEANILRFFRNSATSFSYALHSIAGVTITSGKTYELLFSGNSTTDAGAATRTQRFRANGTIIPGSDNTNWYTLGGNAQNVASTVAYQVTPATNELTVLTEKGSSGGGNARLFALEAYEVATVGNTAPVVTPITDKVVSVGASQQYILHATDIDGQPLTFSLQAGAPAWVTLVDNDDDTATLTIAPTVGSATGSPYNVQVNVTDGIATVSDTFQITVNATNTAPVLAAIADQTIAEGATPLVIPVSATDTDGNSLQLSISNQPPFVVLVDNGDGTGTITITPSYSDAGTYNNIIVTVSDGSLTDTELFSLTVTNVNRAPVLDSIGNTTVTAGAVLTVGISAEDPDGQSLTLTVVDSPTWITLEDNLGTSATLRLAPPSDTAAGSVEATVRVSDGSLTDEETITITVNVIPAEEATERRWKKFPPRVNRIVRRARRRR